MKAIKAFQRTFVILFVIIVSSSLILTDSGLDTTRETLDGSKDMFSISDSPKASQIDDTILFHAIDMRNWSLSHYERYLLSSFEGIVNKVQDPILFVDEELTYDWLVDLNSTSFYSVVWLELDDLESLLDYYANVIEGIILWNDLPECGNVATPLTGAYNSVMVHENLYPEIKSWNALSGKEIKVNVSNEYDLAGLNDHSSYAEIYSWAFERFYSLCNPNGLGMSDNVKSFAIRSQLCGEAIFTLWQPMYLIGQKDPRDNIADLNVFEDILANTPENIIVYGYMKPYGGNEHPVVAKLSEYGKFLVPTDFFRHLPFWSKLPLPENYEFSQEQSRNIADIPLENKLYVAGIVSDGDNLVFISSNMKLQYWDNYHGTVPMSYELTPSILNLTPAMAMIYYNQMSSNDYFVSGLGGKGYAKTRYASPEYFDQYWTDTSELMGTLDQRELRSTDSGDLSRIISYYTDDNGEKEIDSIIEGYLGCNDYMPELVDGVPFMQTLKFAGFNESETIDEQKLLFDIINKQSSQPQFLTMHIHCWDSSYDAWAEFVQKMEEESNGKIKFVTSGQLSQLMKLSSLPVKTNYWEILDIVFMVGLIGLFSINQYKTLYKHRKNPSVKDHDPNELEIQEPRRKSTLWILGAIILLGCFLSLNILALRLPPILCTLPSFLIEDTAVPHFFTIYQLTFPMIIGSGLSLLSFGYYLKKREKHSFQKIGKNVAGLTLIGILVLILSYFQGWIIFSLIVVSFIFLQVIVMGLFYLIMKIEKRVIKGSNPKF